MERSIAVNQIKLILEVPEEIAKWAFLAESKKEAIWSVLEVAEGSGAAILDEVGLTYNDIW